MIDDSCMQHASPWKGQDLRGWFAGEKLDGCRLYWDGAAAWTRSGRCVTLPAKWQAGLPTGVHLDGEVWAGRGRFRDSCNAVLHGHWRGVAFMVFDAPGIAGTWPERLAAVARRVTCDFAAAIPWVEIEDMEHAARFFRDVRLRGGEGLILHHPGRRAYYRGRCGSVVKLKRDPLTGGMAWRPTGWRAVVAR